ncbi:hypothetical protein [Pengzhenrongella sicca]|uniref:Uncharacterized protein n=1 Tax=Pengzhenrongella sicca TaxID=2819238 RepID=A0A8A4ZK35_9MICO|nr:hypothetical protein [Pengzhenrongella sicca]QTE29958.1 hypothetical protein J4E96_02725 [Pengzhenrongella sicca]
MTRMFVVTKIRLQQALESRESGQGTLEYLGIIVVAALLITALIAGIKEFEIATKVSDALSKITDAIAS